MQRFVQKNCQPAMKKILLPLLPIILLASCKKENHSLVKARLITNTTICNQNVWLAQIENPDAQKHSFLCEKSGVPSLYSYPSCEEYVYIMDVPSALAVAKSEVKFSKWESVPTCLSASATPGFVKVRNLSAR